MEEVKNKKRKNLRRCEGCNEDNPLTLFNKGDLENALDFYYRQSWNKGLVNTRRCDMFIDTIVAFSPSAVFPLRTFRVKAEETK